MEEEEEFYLDELQIIWCDQVWVGFFFFSLPPLFLPLESTALDLGLDMK